MFIISYYDGYYDTIDDLPSEATRTWVIKTIERSDGLYYAYLDADHLVAGSDALYYDDEGYVVVPLGTITVQEYQI